MKIIIYIQIIQISENNIYEKENSIYYIKINQESNKD